MKPAKPNMQGFEDGTAASVPTCEHPCDNAQSGGHSIRIAIVVSHPIQYYAPYYRALAALPGVVLKVFFCNRRGAETYYDRDFKTHIRWDIPLLDGYDFEFLDNPDGEPPGKRPQAYSLLQKLHSNFWEIDNPRVGESLARFCPELVEVHGYSHRTMRRTMRWCNQNKVRVILCSDSNGTTRAAWWKRAAKTVIVKHIYRHLDGALANGDNNWKYHLQYGMPPERIFSRALPIDCDLLRSSAGDAGAARREIRKRHGIPHDAFVVTFAGKLSPVKCPTHLLAAVHRCSQMGFNVWGLLVGEGQLRNELEAVVSRKQMRNVVLAGFVNQSEISRYYAASDVVTLMSRYEPKGLAVPEAGSLGCPAILSDRVGCIGPNDCARPEENALVYPWGDIEAFANCIVRIYEDRRLYSSMSEAAIRIANLQDAKIAAAQMNVAVSKIMQMTLQ